MRLGSLLDYRFSDEHEWICEANGLYTIGISDFAQDALGDIVFVQLPDDRPGANLRVREPCGEIESTKSVSDIYPPVDCEFVESNEDVVNDPDRVNRDPYGGGWLFRVKVHSPGDLDGLRNLVRYRAEVTEQVAHVFFLDEWRKIHYVPAVRAEDGVVLAQNRNTPGMITGSLVDVSRLRTWDVADEFEALINDPRAHEAQIRRFFEQHPEFLLGSDYQSLHAQFALRPQLTLHQETSRDMRPDFILRPVAGLAEDARVVDLGLPTDRNLRPAEAGGGLFDNIVEAVRQLRAYARYFDMRENRDYVRRELGFTPYIPRLTLIVGKEIEIDPGNVLHRALLQDEPVEILTYGEVLRKYREQIG